MQVRRPVQHSPDVEGRLPKASSAASLYHQGSTHVDPEAQSRTVLTLVQRWALTVLITILQDFTIQDRSLLQLIEARSLVNMC